MEKFLLILLENPWVLAAILAWTLPWKGVALWKAARRGHLGWFLAILLFNTFAVLEIVYLVSHRKKVKSEAKEDFAQGETGRIVRRNDKKLL